MSNNQIFDNNWMNKPYPERSWVNQVLEDYDDNGAIYLRELSDWFNKYPGSNKRKKGLKKGLLNFNNSAHLGAVNELSWWAYINSRGYNITPIPEGKKSTADFEIKVNQTTIICEVSTINALHNEDCQNLQYSQENTKRRIVNKATKDKDKLHQFIYGSDKKCPVILVLFNYDEWSGFGTQLGKSITSYISGYKIPKELSAIVCLERHVIGGKSMYKNNSTSVFLNPSAQFDICENVIESLMEDEIEWSPCERA
ncbi:MAG: hypothetical protein GY820_17980 [Gammaproteobacteria bacterium]|nr:hypothetical protein [Gammaproteobacteria bacterium]